MEFNDERLEKPLILVVDDNPDNLILITGLLKRMYKVKIAIRGEKALTIAQTDTPPDLILLDIMMPDMDGYMVCQHLKANPQTCDIPIIFLTAKRTVEDEQKGFELGAVDYLTKPVSPPILMARVKNHLALKTHANFLRDKSAYLEEEISHRTREISAIQDVTILTLASLAETRDSDTGNHIRRTQFYVKALAETLRANPRFRAILTEAYITTLFKSAPLHDIGKVGIPDHILLKPGRLEPEEFAIMKRHSELGKRAIEQAEEQLGITVDFLQIAKEIAYGHHEKWDGSGYPQGIGGAQIPVSARLMAIADVYDALICRRVYKDSMSHEQAVSIIFEGKGAHFDPDMVDAFTAIAEDFRRIAIRYADSLTAPAEVQTS